MQFSVSFTGSGVVILLTVFSGACSSSPSSAADLFAGDVRAADVRAADVARADRKRDDLASPGDLDASMCSPTTACPEECLDAKSQQPPIFALASTWGNSSNTGFLNQLTTDPRRCQWQSLNDSCMMFDCLSSEWNGAAAIMQGPSAGNVTVTNGRGASATLSPAGDGAYTVKSWPMTTWKAGDQIAYSAEGATIPAFAVTVDFPALVQASDPLTRDSGSATEVDRNLPLTFSWIPTDEKVLAIFSQQSTSGTDPWDTRQLWCVFDGAAGTGTIPAAVLQQLKLGQGTTGYGVGHYNRRCYNVGGFHLQATATHGMWWRQTTVK